MSFADVSVTFNVICLEASKMKSCTGQNILRYAISLFCPTGAEGEHYALTLDSFVGGRRRTVTIKGNFGKRLAPVIDLGWIDIMPVRNFPDAGTSLGRFPYNLFLGDHTPLPAALPAICHDQILSPV